MWRWVSVSETWLHPSEAARRLGVKPQTLYAYVSRGQLRRRSAPEGRGSQYHADDIVRLAVRGRRARPASPSDVILPTAITAIGTSGPVYRGRPAIELAGTTSFEQTAALLWQSDPEARWACPPAALEAARGATAWLDDAVEPAQRLLLITAAIRTVDPLRHDLRPAVVASAARSLVATTTATLTGRAGTSETISVRLAEWLAGTDDPAVAGAIDAALVLLADHELAASTLAVRVAASARSDPYAAVAAGFCVVGGHRHGRASRPLELVLRDIDAGDDAASALARRLPPDRPVSGFGHELYPDGDPRASRLLQLLDELLPAPAAGPLQQLVQAAHQRGLPPPNIDTALAGLTFAIGAPVGTGELLFSLARTVGWVAHAVEQYDDPGLLRPRAVYTGG